MTTLHMGEIGRRLIPVVLGGLLVACALDFPIQRGEELGMAQRWEEAVRAYQEAVKADPRNTEARLGLARAMMEASQALAGQGYELERADRVAEASVAYRRALSYNGENQVALAGLERLARSGLIQERLGARPCADGQERMARRAGRGAGRPPPGPGAPRGQGTEAGDLGEAGGRGRCQESTRTRSAWRNSSSPVSQ